MLLDRLRGNPIDTPQAPRSILPDNIPLEFQVLLSACRVFLGTEEPSSLEAGLAQGPDWDRLLALANRHGVMPLLYRSISKNCPQAVPQEWLKRLMLQYMQNAARNMKMTGELLRILDLFEENGIAAIPFKGPALAQQIYGDIKLRTFTDLDIIVHKNHVLRAKEILLNEGYRTELKLNSYQEKLFLGSECELTLYHKGDKRKVEIHWQLIPRCYSICFNVELIWSQMGSISLEGRNVPTLSADNLLIALCIHGAGHRWNWNQLKLVCDIAWLVYFDRNLDWKNLMSHANKFNIERLLLLGLKLADALLGAKFPSELLNKAENDPAMESLVSSIVNHPQIYSQKQSKLAREFTFWLLAHEHFLDRLSCILRLSLEPTAKDWILVPLPAQLYSAYYLIHPLRLVFDYVIMRRP